MTHGAFVAAYRDGSIRVNVDRAAAGAFVNRRLLLPLVRLPVLGFGVALALIGWIWTGLIIIAVATIAPILIKRSAPQFVISQALEDEHFYNDAASARVIELELLAKEGGRDPP